MTGNFACFTATEKCLSQCRIKIRIVQDFSTWHKQIKVHFSYFKKPQRYAIRAGTVGSLNPALQSTLKSLFLFILSDFHWIYRWETRTWEWAKIASQNKYWWCKRLTKSCWLYICDYMILFIGSYGYLYSSLFRFSLTLTVSFVYFTTVPFIFLYSHRRHPYRSNSYHSSHSIRTDQSTTSECWNGSQDAYIRVKKMHTSTSDKADRSIEDATCKNCPFEVR